MPVESLSGERGEGHLKAMCKPGDWEMVSCVPLVFRSYSACVPLVLLLLSGGGLRATTEPLPGTDSASRAVIQTELRWLVQTQQLIGGFLFQ
jgi:hypothetical protein